MSDEYWSDIEQKRDELAQKDICFDYAESYGALAIGFWSCTPIFGIAVEIGQDVQDIQEGFETVNQNFHTASSQPAAPVPEALGGNFEDYDKGIFV